MKFKNLVDSSLVIITGRQKAMKFVSAYAFLRTYFV